MTLENETLSVDVAVDIDITIMTSKRCKGRTPSLLRLSDTKENSNLVERYVFWNVIWKPLSKAGWILDKDGNYECEFIVISPLDSICNTMKKNMDFFDDEVELMLALLTDPRLVIQSELRELRELYDEYLLQYKLLRAQVASQNGAFLGELACNMTLLKVLGSRVQIAQVAKRERTTIAHDERESIVIQSIVARQQQEQALSQKANETLIRQKEEEIRLKSDTLNQHEKRLHREMIMNEYERRKQMNGGKFPSTKFPTEEFQQQEQLILKELEQRRVREASIHAAVATVCQPSVSPAISVASLQQMVQLQQRQQILQQQVEKQQLLTSQALVEPRLTTAIPEAIKANLVKSLSNPLMQQVERAQKNSSSGLKLSWNEIKDAFQDLKGANTTVPPSIGVPNQYFNNNGEGVLDALANPRKRLRLF